MRVHVVATRAHYARHLLPILNALPHELQGTALVGPQAVARRLPRTDLVLIAASQDIPNAAGHRTIYAEHGAGQAYNGDPRSRGNRGYHGATHADTVIGYLAPRQQVALAWQRPAAVVGCPALDHRVGQRPTGPTTVAITFHWNAASVSPEARSAFDHYAAKLASMIAHIRASGYDVIGHWHPRWTNLRAFWRELAVDVIPDWETVLDECHALVCDNSSAMYEFAALGRPVIALNAPWYRRTVHHGLRFWDYVPGVQVDSGDDFCDLDLAAVVDDDIFRLLRERAARYTYGVPIGCGSQVVARWVADRVAELG